LTRGAAATGEIVAVATLATVGVALRLYRLDLGWFGIDQARDVATALDIASGRAFPLIGPTMRRVTRLGALYHYFWSIPYLVWRDPIGGYWFAALLAVLALLLTWWLARRLWGPLAAVVALAFGAAHPIWVIDGRVCWAPAALPALVVLLLAVLVGGRGALSARRAAVVGALLGVAVQLHLTMVAWAIAVAAVMLVERVPWRALASGALAALVVAAPAGAAMLWNPDPGGLGALASRGPRPAVAARLVAVGALPGRVLAAFDPGTAHTSRPAALLGLAAAAALTVLAAGGLARLAVRAVRGERAARAIVLMLAIPAAIVIGLRGEVWYYYLDGLLPLWALAAGALVAPPLRTRSRGSATTPRVLAAALAVATAGVLAARVAAWLAGVAGAGVIALEPALLTLDGTPTRDAPSAGRVVTLGIKRRVAAFATAAGGDLGEVWMRLHGPAWSDATGDNGFWTDWYARAQGGVPAALRDRRHVAVWYRDDPTAARIWERLGASGAGADDGPFVAGDVEATLAGPLLAVRYPPAVDYTACRALGTPVTVPIRVVPDPKRYGDGAPAKPGALPSRVECALAPGGGATLVVAALDGAGTVVLVGPDGTRAPPGLVSARCVQRGAAPVPFTIEIDDHGGAGGELDVYDVPLGAGCMDGG
jgi:hypothetical protein